MIAAIGPRAASDDARREPRVSSGSAAVAATRFALAATAVVVLAAHPAPREFGALTYGALAAYVVYSVFIALATVGSSAVRERVHRHEHFLDAAWCAALITLSGTSGVFYFGFISSILGAAFRRGLREALRITAFCVALSCASETLVWYRTGRVDLSLVLTRAAFVAVFGFVVAYWGETRRRVKRRLVALGSIGPLCNPRFGSNLTLATALEQLRALYDADSCVLVSVNRQTDTYYLRCARRDDAAPVPYPVEVNRDAGRLLLSPADGVLRSSASRLVPRRVVDPVVTAAVVRCVRGERWLTAAVPDAPDLVSRVYLSSPRDVALGDVRFLGRFFARLRPVIDTLQLVERLIVSAVDDERKRHARDVLVQPVVAIQMALGAIRAKWEQGRDVRAEIDAVVELATFGVAHLREYGDGLNAGDAAPEPGSLKAAVDQLARTFGRATGMHVEVPL